MPPDPSWVTKVLPTVIAFALLITTANCQEAGGTCFVDNSIILETINEQNPCTREYLRCDRNVWRRNMCAGGVIQENSGECIPFNETCPEPGAVRYQRRRRRRQASTTIDCTRSYTCPSNLNNIFIYPDWSNPNCDSYVVCAAGRLFLTSCLEDNYNYYNPRTLSCEEFPSLTNTCVYRANTDLSPIYTQNT